MRPDYVDFHAHLDLYSDLAQAIAICDRRRTATLAVTTTPKAFPKNFEMASRSEFVRVGLGLHPQLVAERHDEIELFESLLAQTRYVGEVGLDCGPAHFRSIELQKVVFARILSACARQGGKVLSIHSVRSSTQVLDMLDEHLPLERGVIVLHWFTGSGSDLRRAIDRGCYFSVNEGMLASASGKRAIQEIPLNRMLTETDGPFLTRGSVPIGPGDVKRVIGMVAKIVNLPIENVQRQILANLKSLLEAI